MLVIGAGRWAMHPLGVVNFNSIEPSLEHGVLRRLNIQLYITLDVLLRKLLWGRIIA